ncbi:phosphoglycolate phosphatase [Roseovarius azorensis]|uniref:Phosphoglycolate phosphatase n=1 Tax=Roseovarius azorensis TaxID=1287727 RepID=A0A1H7PW15_9RHOB|nr:HAD-IA family hydrolase [Roseovarius azorensis]SEL39922.1 phosphoglycolate phosphatase [Roseovarius azorensis]
MSRPERLIMFDVDGTLVDSQGDILAAMTHAFERADHAPPLREAVLGIVGLSLDVAIPRLAPHLTDEMHGCIVGWYKEAYMGLRAQSGVVQSSPLYPHALDTLRALHAAEGNLLGVATGKSARGLDKLLDGHDLRSYFVTRQVADHHPSKPHPSMLLAALAETGVASENAVMIGDTSFDMEMARAAGIAGIGVAWGYHRPEALGTACAIARDFRDLPGLIDKVWG